MKILKSILWWALAVVLTILTLGIWTRAHLVTVRLRATGGVRAGMFGGTHVYTETAANGTVFLVISTWHGKTRFPASRIANASTFISKVSVESSGGKTSRISAWKPRTVAAFIGTQVTGV
jgi:hypothetical protein